MEKEIVHIALIGGQPMPVYLGLRETAAKKVILIHSSETKKQAERIKSDFRSEKVGCLVELLELEPFDYSQIRDRVERLLESYGGWTVEVNVSGGTKPWSIVIAMFVEKYSNLHLVYVDQNNVIYNYASSEKHPVASLSISEIFKYNQTSVQSHTNLDEYTDEDKNVLRDIKLIRSKYNKGKPSLFNTLTIPVKRNKTRFANNVKDTVVDAESQSEISWNKRCKLKGSDIYRQHVRLYFVGKCGCHEEFELISPHAFDLVTSSGWFEYEFATILRKWSACKEVWLNTIFPYNNKNPKNEIDIIARIGQKLLFVECKTQVSDNTDIDKFSSAVRNYGGLGAKAIFVTQQDMGAMAKEKCETNGIAYFSLFNAAGEKIVSQLFDKLDELMQISNTR